MSSKLVITIAIIATLFLLVANFSIWLNNNVFDRENFVKTSVSTIRTQETRNAIAGETVDQLFKNSPIAQQVAGDTLTSAVSGLLGSRVARPILEGVAGEVNILLTSERPAEVTIDLSGIKEFIAPVASVLEGQLGGVVSDTKLPSEIVLVEKGGFPSIYSWGIVLLWLGPLLGLLGLAAVIGLIWRTAEAHRPSVLKITGLSISTGALIFMILVRIPKAPLLGAIESANVRIIAGNLFDAFAGTLTSQTWILAVLGLLLISAGYLLPKAEGIPDKVRHLKVAS